MGLKVIQRFNQPLKIGPNLTRKYQSPYDPYCMIHAPCAHTLRRCTTAVFLVFCSFEPHFVGKTEELGVFSLAQFNVPSSTFTRYTEWTAITILSIFLRCILFSSETGDEKKNVSMILHKNTCMSWALIKIATASPRRF